MITIVALLMTCRTTTAMQQKLILNAAIDDKKSVVGEFEKVPESEQEEVQKISSTGTKNSIKSRKHRGPTLASSTNDSINRSTNNSNKQ